jgi:hypothetical protein
MTKRKIKPEISVYVHEGVNKDGTMKDGSAGAVYADGHISVSAPCGGCDLGECNCSPGHWIAVSLPRSKDGLVIGVTFTFKSRTELLKYLHLFGGE